MVVQRIPNPLAWVRFLPPLPIGIIMSELSKSLYNDTPIKEWKQILNDNMDYHYCDPMFNSDIFSNVKTVLDIGCGWGGLARELQNKFNLDVTCLSNSPQQIDYIKPDFKTILADADTFKTGLYYDLILYVESICHIKDITLQNISNNTNTIMIHDFVSNRERNYQHFATKVRTRDQYEKLLNDAGFEMTRFHEHPYQQWIKESEFWLNNITPNMSYQIRVLKQFTTNILNGTYSKHNVNCCSIVANKMK